MRFKAHLRNVAFEAALALGLAAPALPQQKAPPLNEREQTFVSVIGASGAPAETVSAQVQADTLIELAFGEIALPDPDTLPSLLIKSDAIFDRTEKDYGASTRGRIGFTNGTPDLFTKSYLKEEGKVFAPAWVNAYMLPVNTPQGVDFDLSIEAHEVTHALHERRLALTELLGLSEPQANIGQSRFSGHGPALEALLQKGETPEQTEARHQDLQKMKDTAAQDNSIPEYPLLYTEIRSYLMEMLADRVAGHFWSRLPQTRGELWAAFADILGEVPPGDNEVRRFLATPEGARDTVKFMGTSSASVKDAQGWLKIGYSLIKPAQQADYFIQVLPEIYGELLEDLGDTQGKVKMGLPASPLYAFNFADHLIHANREPATPEEWNRWAGEVEPQAFERLCELALIHRQPLALKALLETEKTVPGHELSRRAKSSLLLNAQNIAGWEELGSPARVNAEENIGLLRKNGASLPSPAEGPAQSASPFTLAPRSLSLPPGWGSDFERSLPPVKEKKELAPPGVVILF